MSYAGKFVGLNVGSWLGAVESDPNALNAGLSGTGAANGALAGVGQLQAALFGTGDIAAVIDLIGVSPEPPIVIGGGVGYYRRPPFRIPVDLLQAQRVDEDELIVLVIASALPLLH